MGSEATWPGCGGCWHPRKGRHGPNSPSGRLQFINVCLQQAACQNANCSYLQYFAHHETICVKFFTWAFENGIFY